jgi:hypothetical protein
MLNGNRMKSGRERHSRDFYKTPYALAEAAMRRIRDDEEIGYWNAVDGLDAGCGDGIWGQAAQCLWWASDEENFDADIDGIDINPQFQQPPNETYNYNKIIKGDFLTYDFGNRSYDIVFGNPPYSVAEEFIRKAYSLVIPEGYVYFLLRLSFLEGINRGKYLFKEIPLKRVYVLSRRPSFFSVNGRHTTDTLAYAMFLWQKDYTGRPEIDFLDWEYNK